MQCQGTYYSWSLEHLLNNADAQVKNVDIYIYICALMHEHLKVCSQLQAGCSCRDRPSNTRGQKFGSGVNPCGCQSHRVSRASTKVLMLQPIFSHDLHWEQFSGSSIFSRGWPCQKWLAAAEVNTVTTHNAAEFPGCSPC